jgi:hypothetical protein
MASEKLGIKSNLVLHNPVWQRVLSFLGESDLDAMRQVDKNLYSMVQGHSIYNLKRLRYFLVQSVELISSEFIRGCLTSINDQLATANFSQSRASNIAVIDLCLRASTKDTSVLDVTLAEIIRLVMMGQGDDALAHFKAYRGVFEDQSDQLLPFAAAFGSTKLLIEVFGHNTSLQETIVDAENKANIADRFERFVVSAIRWACYFGRADSLEILIKARISRPLPVGIEGGCLNEDQIATCFGAAMDSDSPRVVSTLLHYNLRLPLHAIFKLAIAQGAVKVIHMLFNQRFRNDYFAEEQVRTSQFIDPFLIKARKMRGNIIRKTFADREYVQASHCLRQYFDWIDHYVNMCDFASTGSVDFARSFLIENPQLLAADLPRESIDRIHELAISSRKVAFIHFLMSPNHFDKLNGRGLFAWPENFSFLMTPVMLHELLENKFIRNIDNQYYHGDEYCEILWSLVECNAIRLFDQIEGKDCTWFDSMQKISGRLHINDFQSRQRARALLTETANGLRVVVLQQVESYLEKRKDAKQSKENKAISFGIRSAIVLREELNKAEDAAAIFQVMLQHLRRQEGKKGPGYKDNSLDMLIIEALIMNPHSNQLLAMRLPTVHHEAEVLVLPDNNSFKSQCAVQFFFQKPGQRMWSYVNSAANNRKVHELFTRSIAGFDRYCSGRLSHLLRERDPREYERAVGQAPQ